MFSKYYNNLIILTTRNELLPKSNSVNKKNIIKFTTILYLILHVSIIVIFEIMFYFLFVIKKEYQVFDYLINDIAKHNINYDDKTKLIIQGLLKNLTKYINITNLDDINNRAIEDKQNRLSRENYLFKNSLVIILCLGTISLLIVNIGIYYKKIKVKCLIFDLLLLLCMISVFEYIFFTKIISHIQPISVYELLNQIINEVKIKY